MTSYGINIIYLFLLVLEGVAKSIHYESYPLPPYHKIDLTLPINYNLKLQLDIIVARLLD